MVKCLPEKMCKHIFYENVFHEFRNLTIKLVKISTKKLKISTKICFSMNICIL